MLSVLKRLWLGSCLPATLPKPGRKGWHLINSKCHTQHLQSTLSSHVCCVIGDRSIGKTYPNLWSCTMTKAYSQQLKSDQMGREQLSFPEKIVWTLANLCLGTLPSMILFFHWVAVGASALSLHSLLVGDFDGVIRNQIKLNGTIKLEDTLFNVGLFMFFGVVHSVFAQAVVHKMLKELFPVQVLRTVCGGNDRRWLVMTRSCPWR